ncbi:hypothetical protein Pse7367_0132 [Thalassoporum mexicanum PCC 7367]|uniref:PIN-like domain-containing protein n=1 Tax=Thalassoporum mexicanum TaxID=3457544 RepID=UPI00029FDF81|nr:PIN-like domain-containing protein [Pseudanabaena sp. PCC 7367]AFY68449.1 hypothetical protein Pse7367_0132 [Pseudanabaena sp. PCC 7367]
MRDLFPGYYRPTEDEFKELWEKCIFVLDANVLLNLYRLDAKARDDFLGVLQKVKDRLWMPYQVALEYQFNRIKAVQDCEGKFKTIETYVNKAKSGLKTLQSDTNYRFAEAKLTEFINKIDTLIASFRAEFESLEQDQVKSDQYDFIREKIDYLFSNCVGQSPESQDELDQIYREGEMRYKAEYPPGFCDWENKKDSSRFYNGLEFKREFGDLIIWKQILEKVSSENIESIIFITDDRKEDWWWKTKGNWTLGPHPELVREIKEAGAKLFYMYSSESFLKWANKYLDAHVPDESIEEIKENINTINIVREIIPGVGNFQNFNERDAVEAFQNFLENDYIGKSTTSSGRVDLIHVNHKEDVIDGYEVKFVHEYQLQYPPSIRKKLINGFSQICSYLQNQDIDRGFLVIVFANSKTPSLLALESELEDLVDSLGWDNMKLGFVVGFLTDLNNQATFKLLFSSRNFNSGVL